MPVNHNMPPQWRGALSAAASAPDELRADILSAYVHAGAANSDPEAAPPTAIRASGLTNEHPWRLVSCWVPSKTNPGTDAYFEIYRAQEVSLTSTLRSGGDWRWRLCTAPDHILASGRGYRTEGECTAAVEQLKHFATGADIRPSSATH
ncbi:DUF1508 domain-containing protein [Sphingomonas sp. LaA6.9]|uniref:YegP family protein n=1 Tax=Sphingomonas sp. LaA6.9 TaxID=2919914 RepID=UPI001F4FAB7F|nr:DUF1508 domain-containing protein [Sphingomonas sp. LaA6.9]MCJ8158220.1 DUF1508 domain-containing protein [Sphingomonas sp. LaA6.9]